MKKSNVVFSVLVTSSVLLAACGSEEAEQNQDVDNSSEEQLASEQVLNLVETAEIPSMDTAIATDTVSFVAFENTFEGLYRYDENNVLVDGIAEGDPDISEDGKTYTFHLREDAKWSNGDPVIAHDFEYAWKRVLDPTTGSEYAYIMYDIKNASKVNAGELPVDDLGVKAIDDYTLEVELENAAPYFQGLTSFGTFMPQNQAYVESQGEQYALEADTTIYNGPFVLSEWDHEKGWQYEKNEEYWDADTVQLDEINVDVVKDTQSAVNLYETGGVDRVMLTSDFVDKYKEDEGFGTLAYPSIFFLRLNETGDLANTHLRKAISMSFDKDSLAEVILNDGSIPLNGFMPSGFLISPEGEDFRTENGDLLTYNVKEAQQELELAKQDLGKDTFSIELLTYDTDENKQVGEYLQSQIETNLPGVTIELKQQPLKQKLELEQTMDYQMSISGWSPDYQDPMTFADMFVTDGSNNETGYSNVEYDQLIQDSKTTLATDLETRWDSLLESEKILMEDVAIAPIYQKGSAYLQQPYVKGLTTDQYRSDYRYKWAYIVEHE